MTEHTEETEAKAAEPYEPPALVAAGQFAEVTRGPVIGHFFDGYAFFPGT